MPNQELSLVPADSSSQQFSTKGSVDWAGLGRMQFSASVAILGRLAAAGVEPLTVAVGQAMCSRIPLGVHGEKVLMEAMGKLQAFSSFGDLIWFGVGVRHILRTLVQTSQGASLVALCAALAEGHSIPTAALMIFEMSKVLGSPDEIRPSFAQWQALVKVCSSVLTVTTFGVRLQQLLNLCELKRTSETYHGLAPGYGDPAYPPEFAEAVLAIGRVASGTLEDIELTGDASCTWLAVFAEYLLGLRVQVRKDSGQLLTMNHGTDQKSQVVVILGITDITTSALRRTGQSYVISSGADFIERFFTGDEKVPDRYTGLGGRVPWQSLLHDVFGNVVDELLKPITGRQWMPVLKSPRNIESSRQDVFLTMMVYAAEKILSISPVIRYGSVFSFLQQTPTKLPELTPIQDLLLKKSYELRQPHEPIEPGECIESSAELYKAAEDDLASLCGCSRDRRDPEIPSSVYCIVGITKLIVWLLYMLEHLDVDSPILPHRFGVIWLYELLLTQGGDKIPSPYHLEPMTGKWRGNERLRLYICLFSGSYTSQLSRFGEPVLCALGGGAIYCYMDTVKNVTDKVEQAYRVHVGAGTINLGSEHRDQILDGQHNRDTSTYPAQEFVFDDGFTNLFSDTTSPNLRMKSVVGEGVNISFWYEFSNGKYYTQVSPAALADKLFEASRHRVLMRSNSKWQISVRLIEDKQLRVIGEGCCQTFGLDDLDFNIVLRPHHGNLLGRIVSLIQTGKRGHRTFANFLVDNKDDLARAKLWIREVLLESSEVGVICCFIS